VQISAEEVSLSVMARGRERKEESPQSENASSPGNPVNYRVHLLQRAAEESTSGRLVPPREIDRCGNALRAQVPGQVEELLLASSIVIKRDGGARIRN